MCDGGVYTCVIETDPVHVVQILYQPLRHSILAFSYIAFDLVVQHIAVTSVYL